MSTTTDPNGNGESTETETITVGEDGETLPVVELLTGRGFCTGKSGSGKSNSMSVVVEELLDGGYPVLIVDTDGEYYGLKEEYELLHVGADEECDIQVSVEHAEKIASLALDSNVPIILDVSGFLDESDADDLLLEVARHLFAKEKKLKQPFLMLVEEIHEYVPEGGGLSAVGQMLVKIAKRGRKHGLGITGISQRPADVKKDFITQCDWMVWHRLTWANDTKVVSRVLGSEYASEIESMADGEAFVVTDWNDEIRRVQWRRKRTFDAGATPGLDDFERPDLKSVSDDLVDELEAISDREERREDELERKDRRIDELEARLEETEQELQKGREMGDMAEKFTDALLARDDSGGDGGGPTETTIQAEVAEIREEKNDRIAELESALDDRDETITDLRDRIAELEPKAERAERLGDVDLDVADEALARLGEALGLDVAGDGTEYREEAEQYRERIAELQGRVEELESERTTLDTDVLEHPQVGRYINRMQGQLRDLDEYEAEMLRWFKFSGPGSAKDAYFHAGGSRKSSAYNGKRRTLAENDFIEGLGSGEYRYALPETVGEWFDGNDAVDESDVEAIVLEIESALETDGGE